MALSLKTFVQDSPRHAAVRSLVFNRSFQLGGLHHPETSFDLLAGRFPFRLFMGNSVSENLLSKLVLLLESMNVPLDIGQLHHSQEFFQFWKWAWITENSIRFQSRGAMCSHSNLPG